MFSKILRNSQKISLGILGNKPAKLAFLHCKRTRTKRCKKGIHAMNLLVEARQRGLVLKLPSKKRRVNKPVSNSHLEWHFDRPIC